MKVEEIIFLTSILLIFLQIHIITRKKRKGKDRKAGEKTMKKRWRRRKRKVILYLIFPNLEGKGKRIKVSYLNSEVFKIFITFPETLIHSHPIIMQS